jgi:hypothetical protein
MEAKGGGWQEEPPASLDTWACRLGTSAYAGPGESMERREDVSRGDSRDRREDTRESGCDKLCSKCCCDGASLVMDNEFFRLDCTEGAAGVVMGMGIACIELVLKYNM